MRPIAAALLVVLLAACGERGAEPAPEPARWRVYSSLPHEGQLGDVRLAAMLAFEEHAPRGVEHVPLDSSRPDMAGHDWEVGVVAQNARRAADDPRAMAYVGEIASGASDLSMRIVGRAGIPQVAPGGTSMAFGNPPHFLRVIPGDHLQAAAAVRWMRALGARRLMVVDDGEPGSDAVASVVSRLAARRGILVFERGYDRRRLATIRDLAAEARRSAVDTLYFAGIWQNRAVALWGRVHRAAPHVRLMGGDGLAERAFTQAILRSSRERTHLTSLHAPPPARFARRFRERFGHDPHPLAVYGHDAMRRTLAALRRLPRGRVRDARRALLNELAASPDLDPRGDLRRGRFAGYRVTREGTLRLDRVIAAGG